MIFILFIVFGVFIGICTSLFGFGGGLFVVPLLYTLMHAQSTYSMYIAVATSTAMMVTTSIYATWFHYKSGNVQWKVLFPLILYIPCGGMLGILLAHTLNSHILKYLFLIYVGYTIIYYLMKKKQTAIDISIHTNINKYIYFVLGLLIGMLSILLGIGGSIMTVPLLNKIGFSLKQASATANPLTFPIGVVGVIGYMWLAYDKHAILGPEFLGFIYLPALLTLMFGAIVGVPIGLKISNKITPALHQKLYVLILLSVFIAMIF